MPTNVVKTPADEKKWNEAKSAAAKEGHTKDYAYIMGIFKKMGGLHEGTYNGIIEDVATAVLEVTGTGSVAAIPTPLGGVRGNSSDPHNVATLGDNATAAAAAETPTPETDGRVAAQVYANKAVPSTRVNLKKYVGEAKENIGDIVSLLLTASDTDMDNPLNKTKPTQLGTELSK